MRLNILSVFLVGVTVGIASCSGDGTSTPPPVGENGGSNVGGGKGSGHNAGGSNAFGVGGTSANPSGGYAPTGGKATTGSSAGPTTGGRSSTGGAATGVTVTGGRSSLGGAASGGAVTGGMSSTRSSVTSVTTGGKSSLGGAASGGAATGGTRATGGAASGGAATGGTKATGGASAAVAGSTATGGGSTLTTSTSTTPDIDCTNLPAMPTGGSVHTSSSQGGTNPLAWQVWSNGGTAGTITTFSTPAFSATWNNSQNYLGRLGFEWGNSGGKYDTHGTITAQFASKKSGSANNSWSYVGIYGWTTNPCVEWYIIDDSFSNMPINPGSCTNMSNSPLSVDGGKYTMCVRQTSGTGGDRCGGAGSWKQYYSIRQNNRTCGTISVSEHFKAWEAAGNSMAGNLLEVKILVEVGGGQGTVDFPVAKVTSTK